MASNGGSEFNPEVDREMRLLTSPEVEAEPKKSASKKVCTVFPFRTTLERVLAIVVLVLLLICVIVIALLAVEKGKDSASDEDSEIVKACSFSNEAQRAGLETFLRKVQATYNEHNILLLIPGVSVAEHVKNVETRYRPMNFTPEYLKERTDASLSLYDEINKMKIDVNKLKPREAKAVDQVKQFLRTTFASPYDDNFYDGDWMLGLNHFCWQPICSIHHYINTYSYWVKPKSLEQLEHILDIIFQHGEAVKQYQSNMQLGVKSGMVRSVYSCKSALDSFKIGLKVTTKDNNPKDVLKESFVALFRNESYLKGLSDEHQKQWLKLKGKNVSTSIDDALVEGFGKPIIAFVKYLEEEHLRHCLPKDVSSGLAGLPVDHIYIDGHATNISTTKVLPLTGQSLSGKSNYETILPYFTTSKITPDKIYKIGEDTLATLYPQAVEIARNITGVSDNETAVREFKKLLNASEQYFNDEPFPANESNAAAHRNCSDVESAKLYCPKRWAAMKKWADNGRQVLGMLAPKLIPMFYHTGSKITMPNCPMEILPDFNPSSSAQSFQHSTTSCEEPTYMNIPFFLNNFGPIYGDWSVVAHEGWPGHHTQIQGMIEYFSEQCGDVLKWLDSLSRYSFFSEGWALYAENPVIAEDTDTYDGHLLEKYGMLQWQIWRALRLMVDTGLHYRGMNRTEALELFSNYAWDDGDFAQKEVTRYQGTPGQATAYMLGQQKIIELRKYCENALGDKFDMQDFHYQILSTGSAPEDYLDKHIKQYVKCVQDDVYDDMCDYILYPMPKAKTPYLGEDFERSYKQLSRPFPYHFV